MACPMCERPAAADYKPFCSKRCADIDLAKWFNGSYTIGVVEDDDGGEAEPRGPQEHH